MSATLHRVQDQAGRGPFRPGLSAVWRDEIGEDLPPFYIELGIPPDHIPDLIPKGYAVGCACRSAAELKRWFSRRELRRLQRLGFGIVSFQPDLIIAETPTQVLFGMTRPASRPSPR